MNFNKMKKAQLIELLENEYVPKSVYDICMGNYQRAEQNYLDMCRAKDAAKIYKYAGVLHECRTLSTQLEIEQAKEKSLELCFAALLQRFSPSEVQISKSQLTQAMKKECVIRRTDSGFIISVKDKTDGLGKDKN